MTAHVYCAIRCDERGCHASYPPPEHGGPMAGSHGFTRKQAAHHGWTFDREGDHCPRHSVGRTDEDRPRRP